MSDKQISKQEKHKKCKFSGDYWIIDVMISWKFPPINVTTVNIIIYLSAVPNNICEYICLFLIFNVITYYFTSKQIKNTRNFQHKIGLSVVLS